MSVCIHWKQTYSENYMYLLTLDVTNFTRDKNTWVNWKENKMFNQYPGLSRDQQSEEYSLYVQHLEVHSAEGIQKAYGEMFNQKISAQLGSMKSVSYPDWIDLQINTGCSDYTPCQYFNIIAKAPASYDIAILNFIRLLVLISAFQVKLIAATKWSDCR